MSKSGKGGGGCLTRGETGVFLIGQPNSTLGNSGKLPVAKNILQYIRFLQSLPGMGKQPVKTLVCCPLTTSTKTASCTSPTGCSSPGRSMCVVAALGDYWTRSGIPRVSDFTITKYVLRLHEEWKNLRKKQNQTSTAELGKREIFLQKLESLFDIASPDAIKILESDRLRTAEATQADIDFYLDQKGERIATMAGLDKVHLETVEKKKKRLAEVEIRKEKASSSSSTNMIEIPSCEKEDTVEDIDDIDVDFVAPVERKAKKPDVVPLLVPRNITQTVALNSKRWKMSDTATTSSLALVIKESGGDLDDFVLSTSTCRRQGIKAVTADAENIKEVFKENLKERDLTLHFDGKSVKEFSAGRHLDQERIAVIVSSPTLKSPQVLGVPPALSSKGVDQLAVLTKLIEEWGVKDYIMAIGFDTTASNTGVNAGAVTLIEQYIGKACMWSACQRHVYELHVKHAAESVFGPTNGPSDKLFKKLRDIWPNIMDTIDYSGLYMFDWEGLAGTVLEQEAKKAQEFCRRALSRDTFPREDYKELVQLILVWLGGAEEVTGFKFQWPGAYHHARFMAKSLYILKLDMLSTQISILSKEEREQVARLAIFVGVYFGVWFLQCGLASTAPYRTITSFEQMLNFSEYDNHLAFTVMDSMLRHTWYITPQWVIVCLADTHCPAEERKAVATALARTPRPELFAPGKPDLPLEFWPESGEKPSLASFVGEQSWLLPSLLKLQSNDMEWLFLEVHQWPLMSSYRKFAEFVRMMMVVNDPAERGVKLIQDFVATSTDEDLRQARMLSASDQRKKLSKNVKKKKMKMFGR